MIIFDFAYYLNVQISARKRLDKLNKNGKVFNDRDFDGIGELLSSQFYDMDLKLAFEYQYSRNKKYDKIEHQGNNSYSWLLFLLMIYDDEKLFFLGSNRRDSNRRDSV